MANPRPLSARPLASAGASGIPKTTPIPEGHVALTAPAGASGVSWGGMQYAVKDGVLIVPKAAEGVLVGSHGFSSQKDA